MAYSVLTYVLVATGVIGLVLRWYPARHTPLTAVAAFTAYLLPLPLLGVAVAAYGGQAAAFSVALFGSAVTLTQLVPRYFPSRRPSVVEDGPTWRSVIVLSANLRLGQADARSLVRLVEDHHVDVAMLCELTPQARSVLADAGLDSALPHSFAVPKDAAAGVGLWSRHPLIDTEQHKAFTFPVLSARLAGPDDATDGRRSHSGSSTKALRDGDGLGPLLLTAHMPGPWPRSPKLWHYNINHLRVLLDELAGRGDVSRSAVIVSGDFNATIDSAQFRALLSAGYSDAGVECGAGLARTYPARRRMLPPLIGIDHILLRGATAASFRTLPLPGSDHRAVLSTVRLP
jgi:endonuclease/exonuclease/phosphatase (EEP) superfamily protein YafD